MRVRKEIGRESIERILIESGLNPDYQILASSSSGVTQMLTLLTNNQSFFVKCSYDPSVEGMIQAEFDGLKALDTAGVRTPNHIKSGIVDGWSWLLMEFIPVQASNSIQQEEGGKQTALLHQTTSPHFGWKSDNFIASLRQSNTPKEDWWEFYKAERLLVQLRLAGERIPSKLKKRIEIIIYSGANVFPKEQPSLCHGDLWNGNMLFGRNGKTYMIDPAVYFGHREMDLGMTMLFGGFSKEFYSGYQNHFPLEQHWQKRVPITTLYPLLVHVNLFGASYLNRLEEAAELTEMEVL